MVKLSLMSDGVKAGLFQYTLCDSIMYSHLDNQHMHAHGIHEIVVLYVHFYQIEFF